jgi:hypothetical protein
MAQRDHAGFLDLVQAAGAFGVGGCGAAQEGRGDEDRSKCFHLIPLAPFERRMFMFTIDGASQADSRLVPR